MDRRLMRKLAAAVLFALGVLAWHADAHAACVSTTFIQDGRVLFCQQCCYGNQCTVHCF